VCGLDSEMWWSIGAAHRHARIVTSPLVACGVVSPSATTIFQRHHTNASHRASSYDRTSMRCISADGGWVVCVEDLRMVVQLDFDYLFS
jgi:hypothetical protein